VKNEQTVLVRRDTRDKTFVPIDHVPGAAATLLDDMQTSMLSTARSFVEDNTHDVDSLDAFAEVMQGSRGFIRVNWCGDGELEAEIQQKTSATIRCLLPDAEPTGPCFYTGGKAKHVAIFAKAY
jgi:prolyl-tRNA synthetase